MSIRLPDFSDIEAAAKRIAPWAVVTPLLESPALNTRIGTRVLLKAEPFQRTGSFKFRGACNRIQLIPEAERKRGVVAFSSGNHAQGVAAAAALFDLPATIVMPADAPRTKIENTRSYGARVVTYDRKREDREAIARKIQEESGATLIKPFDDPFIVAGQGTAGLEMAQQARAAGVEIGQVFVPASGGGLASGTALAFALAGSGIAALTIHNRTASKAQKLCERVGAAFADCEVRPASRDAAGHDIVINATSQGLNPDDDFSFDIESADKTALFAEVIMKPEFTPLLLAAKERGHRIHSGVHMLSGQLDLMMDFFGRSKTARS